VGPDRGPRFGARDTYDSGGDSEVSGANGVQLRRLRLALRRQGEVFEVEIRALRVGADQVGRLVRVEERERLRARPVRVDAHGVGRTTTTTPRSSLDDAAARRKRRAERTGSASKSRSPNTTPTTAKIKTQNVHKANRLAGERCWLAGCRDVNLLEGATSDVALGTHTWAQRPTSQLTLALTFEFLWGMWGQILQILVPKIDLAEWLPNQSHKPQQQQQQQQRADSAK
jgi:hypothetical protein